MKLRELQEHFLKSLTTNDVPKDLKDGHHFNVYKKAYVIRLKDSLEEDFPRTLEKIENADEVVTSFIQSHPSSSWTLAELGRQFPEFIRSRFGHELFISALKEWHEWVAFSIGCPDDVSVTPPSEHVAIHVNPSLQLIEDGESLLLTYFWNRDLHEETIPAKWKPLIEQSMELKPLDHILAKLQVEESEVVSLVENLSRLGIILGFREGKCS